jgi:phosphohistidine swiveling domain-containing protein
MEKELNPKNYKYFGQWKQELFSGEFWVSWWNDDFAKKLKLPINKGGFICFNQGHIAVEKSNIDKFNKFLLKKGDFLDEFLKFSKTVSNREIKKMERLSNDVPTKDSFIKFLNGANNITFFWAIAAGYLVPFYEATVNELSDSKKKAIDLNGYIETPKTKFFKFENELRRLSHKIKNQQETIGANVNILNVINKLQNEYAWTSVSNWVGGGIDVKEMINSIDKSQGHKIVKKEKIPKKVLYALNRFNKAGFIKQNQGELLNRYAFLARDYLTKVASICGMTYEEIILCDHQSIINKIVDVSSVLNMTTMNYFVCESSEGISIHSNESLIELFTSLYQVDVSTDTIEGQIGFKGIARGSAVLVLNQYDFSKFKEGQILVTTMTTPDFLMLMKKSSAIITDIGGLLSHAAIVARELKKPCIIGTKIATKVLKDGDLVEVDAEKGVVTILKKSNEK